MKGHLLSTKWGKQKQGPYKTGQRDKKLWPPLDQLLTTL